MMDLMTKGSAPVLERKGTRPCFVDGRLSTKTYLVVATKPDHTKDAFPEGVKLVKNLIGVRNLGDGTYRWHAYPSWEFYGLDKPVMARHSYHNHRYGYDSSILSAEATKGLLNQLNGTRGLVMAPLDQAMKVMLRGYDPSNDYPGHTPHG
jgi:hypothetical protein